MNFSYKLGGLKESSFRFAFANILSSFTFDENLLNFQVSLQKVQPRKLCINKKNWITQIQAFVYKNGNRNQSRELIYVFTLVYASSKYLPMLTSAPAVWGSPTKARQATRRLSSRTALMNGRSSRSERLGYRFLPTTLNVQKWGICRFSANNWGAWTATYSLQLTQFSPTNKCYGTTIHDKQRPSK